MASSFKPHGLITTPTLEILYRRAHIEEYKKGVHDPKEHHTVELLENIYNKVLFKDNPDVFCNSQVPPSPDSNDRCDLALKTVEAGTFDTMIFNFSESKRTKKKGPYNLRETEAQALRYCRQFLAYYTHLPFVYATTSIGAHIRLWKVEANADALWGMWGNPPREADWTQYYDLGNDDHAIVIRQCYNFMLRLGPEPSATQSAETYGGVNLFSGSWAAYEQPATLSSTLGAWSSSEAAAFGYSAGPSLVPAVSDYRVASSVDPTTYGDSGAGTSFTYPTQSTYGQGGDVPIQTDAPLPADQVAPCYVQPWLESSSRGDFYYFKREDGRQIKTEANDWEKYQTLHEGQPMTCLMYTGKTSGKRYFTRSLEPVLADHSRARGKGKGKAY